MSEAQPSPQPSPEQLLPLFERIATALEGGLVHEAAEGMEDAVRICQELADQNISPEASLLGPLGQVHERCRLAAEKLHSRLAQALGQFGNGQRAIRTYEAR